jgi:hypothetical protein
MGGPGVCPFTTMALLYISTTTATRVYASHLLSGPPFGDTILLVISNLYFLTSHEAGVAKRANANSSDATSIMRENHRWRSRSLFYVETRKRVL